MAYSPPQHIDLARHVCLLHLPPLLFPTRRLRQVLSLQDQQDVVRFCVDRNLLLLADEVYQENVYAPNRTFTSFKKVHGPVHCCAVR